MICRCLRGCDGPADVQPARGFRGALAGLRGRILACWYCLGLRGRWLTRGASPIYAGLLRRLPARPRGNSAEAVHHLDVRRGGHIDHLWIGVRDLDAAVAFYTTIMRSVGLREGRHWEAGRQFRGAWATFSLVADGRAVTEHLHLAFPAPDRQAVDDFHLTATKAGYDEAAPPEWTRLHSRYAASVLSLRHEVPLLRQPSERRSSARPAFSAGALTRGAGAKRRAERQTTSRSSCALPSTSRSAKSLPR